MARLIAIGVTEQINVDELNAMSSSPHVENQDFFRVQDVGKLNNIIQEVVITACGPVPSTENNKRHLIPGTSGSAIGVPHKPGIQPPSRLLWTI